MTNQQQTTIDVLAAPVPAARVENLVITDVGDEVLVYDEVQHHIHYLNRTSAVVWHLCDGQRGISDLVRLARPELGAAVDEDVIRLALEELEGAELLGRPLNPQVRVPTHTRRDVVKRLAIGGAASLVATVVSTTAAGASGTQCSSASDCGGATCCHAGGSNSQCFCVTSCTSTGGAC